MSKKLRVVVFLATKLVRGKSDLRVAGAAATVVAVAVVATAVDAMAAATVVVVMAVVVMAVATVVVVMAVATVVVVMAVDAMAENDHTATTKRQHPFRDNSPTE